jgi:hypothetical protein
VRPHDPSLCDYLLVEVVAGRAMRSVRGAAAEPEADEDAFGGDTTPSIRASTLIGHTSSAPRPARARTMTGFLTTRPPARKP